MTQAPPLTNELAARIEDHIARAHFFESNEGPESGELRAVRFGRTVAVTSLRGRPRHEIFHLGPDDIDRLGELLAFYGAGSADEGSEGSHRDGGAAPRIFLSPWGFRPEVAAALTDAGFRQHDFDQGILYGSPVPDPPPLPPRVTFEPVTEANLDAYVRTMADGFEWPSEWRDAAMEGTRTAFTSAFAAVGSRGADAGSGFTRNRYSFLARHNGEPAGVASVAVDEGGVARLHGGAVVPRFRRHGIHLALVYHRLHVAYEQGCDLVLGSASSRSTSFANQQRAGLRLAYVECEWGRQHR